MLIALDIDDVLADLVPALARFHNDRYGTKLKKKDFHSYRFSEVWGGSNGGAYGKMWSFLHSPYFFNLRPMEGAVEGIRGLGNNPENGLISITSRPRRLKNLTRNWIERYFPDISEIYFSRNNYVDFGNSPKKVDYCKSSSVDVLVEDSLEYARECGEGGIKVVLLDQPWNRQETPEGVVRVNNWEGIMKYFK
ncbi:MAG: hypothetical protein KKG75_01565 [Nanoarchaeota archaeon]|nr:hypothetical protein [Nanoarchaeota archaeon]